MATGSSTNLTKPTVYKTVEMDWMKGKPEKSGDYIVSTRYGNVIWLQYWEGHWNCSETDMEHEIEASYVVAWMPFPKPVEVEDA